MTDLLQLSGKLRLKAAERRKWLRSQVALPDPEAYAAAGFGGFDPDTAWGTVQDLLDGLMRDRHCAVKLTYARSPIHITGVLPDDAVAYYWPPLVGACQSAATLGGSGELTLGDAREAARVRVADGEAILESVDLRAAAAAARGPIRVPGIIEQARSGRSRCKRCGEPIAEGTLRFGAQDVARSLPGKPKYSWLHLPCAAAGLPHSFGPVLREHSGEVPDREALLASLPAEARDAAVVKLLVKGQRARVARPGKGPPVGLEGVVVWYGANKYGKGKRVGLEAAGEVHWLDAERVEPI